jgi:hypothetical protein
VNQFLARRNIHGTFKQTWFALFVKTTLSLRYGGGDATRRIRVPACQMILAVLDHALHADNTWADRVDLATPLSKRVSSAMTAILRRPEASACWASRSAGQSPLPAPAIAASERR